MFVDRFLRPSFLTNAMSDSMINFLRTMTLFSILIFGTSFVRAANYGNITVQEIPLAENRNDRTSHGYVEYRFRVTNRDTRSHLIGLRMPKDSYGRGETLLAASTNSVEVPAGSTVILRLLQPPMALGGGSDEVRVAIDGRYQQTGTPFQRVGNHLSSSYSSSTTELAHVFVSVGVPSDIRDFIRNGPPPETTEKLEGEAEVERGTGTATAIGTAITGTPAAPEVIPWLASVPIEEWSDNWLAYTRFDSVALTSGEWRELQERHPDIYDAIRKYVESGGSLCIVGSPWTPPKEWFPDGETNRYRALLGQVFVMDGTVEGAKPQLEPFRELCLKQAQNWRDAFGNTGYSYGRRYGGTGTSTMLSSDTPLFNLMPVVANYGVSVKLIMLLIIVFAVLIGPVNIYVLSLMKRRIWLLWTVPVTSLIASLLVLGVSFFQEGLLRQSSAMTHTILDQRREEAITFGYVGFYSTLTPRGIQFSPDTEASACMDRGYGNSRSLELHSVAGGNQFLTSGWISARVPSYFAIRKAQSQRKERVTFDWDGEKPAATNGLGVDIKSLYVRAKDGKLYYFSDLKAGEKKTTANNPGEETAPESSNMMKKLSDLYGTTLTAGPTNSTTIDRNDLPAGTYVAEIDAWNPFVEQGIERMKPFKTITTIFGIFDDAE